MEFTFEKIHAAEDMRACYTLVNQLTQISEERYMDYIHAMVKSGYFQVVVKNSEGKIVAVSGIWIATKIYSGKYLEMDNVVVDAQYRSVGVGKLLNEYVCALAKQEGCETIMLDAYMENTRAHAFYESKGFIKRGYHFIMKLANVGGQ